MRTIIKVAFFLLALLTLSACSHTGGIIGNLVPAPKLLKGNVDGDIYHSPDGAFSVQLPHPPSISNRERYEWTYSQVREIQDRPVIGVVFGPAAFDLNYYHAVLIRLPMKSDKDKYVKSVFDSKVKGRSGTYTQRHYEKFDLNGKDCYYTVYESGNDYLVLSLTDNKTSFYAVEADVSSNSAVGKPTFEMLTGRSWELFNKFLRSFNVLNDKYIEK